MARRGTTCFGLFAFSAALLIGWLRHGGLTDGTLPIIHAGKYEFTEADIPDLSGRTAIVTGATSGLGLGVARHLQRARAALIVTARTPAKCTALLEELSSLIHDQTEVLEGLAGASADEALFSASLYSQVPTLRNPDV